MSLYNLGMIGSAWTIHISVVGTIVLQSIVMGMTVSITVCISYMYIHSWRPKYEALLIASVSCSSNLLAMAENQLVTWRVNPDNLEPDIMDGPKMFFSQRQVIERVPSGIIMLGGITLALQIVGYMLVRIPTSQQPESDICEPFKYNKENGWRNVIGKTSSDLSTSVSTNPLQNGDNGHSLDNGKCNNIHYYCLNQKPTGDFTISLADIKKRNLLTNPFLLKEKITPA
ncbi:oxalate:formate antiporter [Elysia marginata]|uniref:Oxalate:formate antiporter n=1 Tax=Elysia marginata TaxID=1093978 RepID=A0AAV4IFT9_9GAST|nr:oxalate:formate antiporter [Elysia marginata]